MKAKDEKRNGTGRRSACKDVFLFSHPRTASNLLDRLLEEQPGWIRSSYHYRPAFQFGIQKFNWSPFADISDEHRQGYGNQLQEGLEKLEKDLDAGIAEDKPLFVKNHIFHLWEPSVLSQAMWGGEAAQPLTCDSPRHSTSPTRTNPTVLPDDFLALWLPVFMIRHPALTFDSWYRAETDAGTVDLLTESRSFFTTFQWTRQLYDWYLSKADGDARGYYSHPIVIDADDVIERRSIDKLCEACHMDPACVRYEWEAKVPANTSKFSQRHLRFMNGLWSSTTIDTSKTSRGLDIVAKYEQWKKDFGPEVADTLRERVDRAMPDYNYLLSKKI